MSPNKPKLSLNLTKICENQPKLVVERVFSWGRILDWWGEQGKKKGWILIIFTCAPATSLSVLFNQTNITENIDLSCFWKNIQHWRVSSAVMNQGLHIMANENFVTSGSGRLHTKHGNTRKAVISPAIICCLWLFSSLSLGIGNNHT